MPGFHRNTTVLTATGALWACASLLMPDRGFTPAQRYDRVAAQPTLEGVAGLLFMIVAGLFVASALTIVTAGLSGRGRRAVRIGGVLIGLGATWMATCYAAFTMFFLQLLQVGVVRGQVERLIDGGAEPWQAWFDLALVGVLAGPAVLAVGLRRARRVSWLPLVLWSVGVLGYGAVDVLLVSVRVTALVICTVALFLMGRGLDRSDGPVRSRSVLQTATAAPSPLRS